MNSPRRRVLRALPAALLIDLPGVVRAASYPSQPVRIVVGTAAGAQDIVARLFGQWLSERFGQPFVVESRPGAGTEIAAESVARAAPDGYTLLLLGAPNAINATLRSASRATLHEIAPVAGFLRTPEVLVVHADSPIGSLPALIEYAKKNPSRLNFASPGTGTGPHMSGELLKMMAGIDLTHVPYKGGGPAMNDLLGGRVEMLFIAPVVAMPHVKAGKLRLLGVTSAARDPTLPEVPAIAEFLPGYESGGFFGIGAPRGTPPDLVEALNRETNRAFGDPVMLRRIADMGATPLPGTAAEFGSLLAAQTEKWAKVIHFAGIKAD